MKSMKNFRKVLLNTLLANVTTSYLWFALTFWVYLETNSVLATAIIGGSYMLLVAICSLVFGTIVDKHKKKDVMFFSSSVTLATYILAGIIYALSPHEDLSNWGSIYFWLFSTIILIGGVVENMRNIALSTTVTLLVPKNEHDKANGLVGSVQGVAFLITSVFSGLSIGILGMGKTLALAIIFTSIALLHLFFVAIPEKKIKHDPTLANKKIDIKGAFAAIKVVPGLLALIFFSTFNNFIGGAYMALMDPYGLTLFSVDMWGAVLGLSSTGFIVGGLVVSQKGLGKNPVRTMLLVNIAIGLIGMLFAIREFWILYVVGIFLYMTMIPAVEATEQTVIQKVVPYERQGRVFGFAQSIEAAASPLTAFLIGPIAQFWIMPYVASENGQRSFNWLLGSGEARGIALIFFASGLIVLAVTLLAFQSTSYKRLSSSYQRIN